MWLFWNKKNYFLIEKELNNVNEDEVEREREFVIYGAINLFVTLVLSHLFAISAYKKKMY